MPVFAAAIKTVRYHRIASLHRTFDHTLIALIYPLQLLFDLDIVGCYLHSQTLSVTDCYCHKCPSKEGPSKRQFETTSFETTSFELLIRNNIVRNNLIRTVNSNVGSHFLSVVEWELPWMFREMTRTRISPGGSGNLLLTGGLSIYIRWDLAISTAWPAY